MSKISVRTAQANDKAHCLDLLALLNEDYAAPGASTVFDQLLQTQRGTLLVAEEGDTLWGMASVSYNLAMRYEGEYCQLEELIVDPQARGKQVGKHLMEGVVQTARRRGCAGIGLYLIASTEHNRGFYEQFGFEVVGSEMRQVLS